MKRAVRALFYSFVAVCVAGSVVFAAATGTDFSWLSVSEGGILIGDEGAEGENVPAADTLEFANEDAKVLFSEDHGEIDFRGQGSIAEYDPTLGAARLRLHHDNILALDAGDEILFTSGDGMTFSAGDDALFMAEDFGVLAAGATAAGALLISDQDDPLFSDITDAMATLAAVGQKAAVTAYPADAVYPYDASARLTVGQDNYRNGLYAESVATDLRLTAYHDNMPVYGEGPARSGELILYEEVEGESGASDDIVDTRLIAYDGAACLQSAVFNTCANTPVLTAEVRVEADGDVVIRLGASN